MNTFNEGQTLNGKYAVVVDLFVCKEYLHFFFKYFFMI